MNIIPIIKCKNIQNSESFYTQILDFETLNPESEIPYKWLIRENARLDISTGSGDGVYGSKVYIVVNNVDTLFKRVLERGLDISNKEGVHKEPVNQTWGMREFYVDDPDGNTIRFGQKIE